MVQEPAPSRPIPGSMAGPNLLAAIIIYWNTKHLGQAVVALKCDGLDGPEELLGHISPLGWAHILLTGEYKWKNDEWLA